MTAIYYKIKDNTHTYQIIHSGYHYAIQDDKGKDCISVKVKIINEELYLSHLRYDERCSLHSLLKRGAETVSMIKAFLRFLLNRVQFTKISLIDTSTFECKLESLETNALDDLEYQLEPVTYKMPIPLAYQNLALYGKTWYERHFGATIAEPYVQKMVNESIKNVSAIVKTGIEIERFKERIEITISNTQSSMYTEALQYVLKRIYTHIGKSTWMKCFQDLFGTSGSVYAKYGESITCSLYYELDSLINDMMKLPHACSDLRMNISRYTIQTYPPIEDLGINDNPVRLQKDGGGKKYIRFPSMSLAHYYTRRSLKHHKKNE